MNVWRFINRGGVPAWPSGGAVRGRELVQLLAFFPSPSPSLSISPALSEERQHPVSPKSFRVSDFEFLVCAEESSGRVEGPCGGGG